MKKKRGFNLLELIIVIAIIAVLLLIIVPLSGGFINSATSTACKADEKQILTVVKANYLLDSVKGETDPIVSAKKTLTDEGYTYSTSGDSIFITDTCPGKGTYTLTYDSGYKLTCSIHGSLDDSSVEVSSVLRIFAGYLNTDDTLNNILFNSSTGYFRASFYTNSRTHKAIDSTAPSSAGSQTTTFRKMITDELAEVGLDLSTKCWRIERGSTYPDLKIYMTDTDITKLTPGTVLSNVAVYDTKTKTITYEKVSVGLDPNAGTYNILTSTRTN